MFITCVVSIVTILAREFRLEMDFDILTGPLHQITSKYQSPYTAWILGLSRYVLNNHILSVGEGVGWPDPGLGAMVGAPVYTWWGAGVCVPEIWPMLGLNAQSGTLQHGLRKSVFNVHGYGRLP